MLDIELASSLHLVDELCAVGSIYVLVSDGMFLCLMFMLSGNLYMIHRHD